MTKADELESVRELLRRLGHDGEPSPRESPDFELRLADGRMVGVEVTELADGNVAAGSAAARRLQSEVGERLRFEESPVGVGLRIGEGFAELLIPSDQRRRHVEAILSLVREHVRAGRAARWYRHHRLQRAGIPYVLELFIGPGSGYVTLGQNAVGRREPFVQKCINDKNAKLPAYRTQMPGCDQWLLLVAGVGFRSAVLSAVVEDGKYVSAFDRTFCLDLYEGKLSEIPRHDAPGG